MIKINYFIKTLNKASPKILTGFGILGLIGTTATAIRATPKALKAIEDKKLELETEELSAIEVVQTVGPCYIPTALIGMATIVCIIGINMADKRNQASLASAYAMINESYKRYRQAVKRVYGPDADNRIRAEMAKDADVSDWFWGAQIYNMKMDSLSERMLFYDSISKKTFETTFGAVINAQYHLNRNLQLRGECVVNEWLQFLGLDGIEDGNSIGWDLDELYSSGLMWLDFDNSQKIILDDGLECIVISTFSPNKFGRFAYSTPSDMESLE